MKGYWEQLAFTAAMRYQ